MEAINMDNSKRFRHNKYEVDIDMIEEEYDDFEYEYDDYIEDDFGDDEYDYDENNLTPTMFSKLLDKQLSRNKIICPVQLEREEKKVDVPHPFKWARFTREEDIDSPMVVIGKIQMIRKPNSLELKGTKKKRNYAFVQKKTTIQTVPQNQFCFSLTKGIDCPHYACAYMHNYSQIEACKFKDECKFASKVDDELYVNNNNGKCTKRHCHESIESYLLRLEIKIVNCENLVLKVSDETYSNCTVLRRVLECAQNCGISLIWQNKNH